jgi:tetratricopeptide (TPR) repeat protein
MERDMTPINGVTYYRPPSGTEVSGLDGKVVFSVGPEPIPLLDDDYNKLQGELPGYDAVGRGIYQALRTDPGCRFCERYAEMLKGYPHYISELASHILMLGEKDVEVPYLERRVKLLRIFALLEPENAHFPLEIGATLLDQACRFSALHLSTVTLFKAEGYLDRARELGGDQPRCLTTLAEVSFLLGKYDKAASLWSALLPEVEAAAKAELKARLERIERGEVPRVPAVDYLEAIAGAMTLREEGGYLEATAILNDVMADAWFALEFPMAEIPYLLALCCQDLGAAADARFYLRQALKINPEFAQAQTALEQLQQ